MSLSDIGLYGLNSERKPEFARLVPFETKKDHSNYSEPSVYHGCHGTLHPDKLPGQHIYILCCEVLSASVHNR